MTFSAMNKSNPGRLNSALSAATDDYFIIV